MKHSITLILLVSCSGEPFNAEHATPTIDASDSEASLSLGDDSSTVLEASSQDSSMEGHSREASDTEIDSSIPIESGHDARPEADPPPTLTCPTDVSHCEGKAWNGSVCADKGNYSACCNQTLCWCCLG